MPTTLSANLILQKNKMETASAWIPLLEITLTDGTVLRFARNFEDITFEGELFLAFNFELDSTSQSNKGEMPTVTLKVSNITRYIHPYLEALGGAVGSIVKIMVVNTELLTEDYSGQTLTLTVLDTTADTTWITFRLGGPNLLNRRFPLERFLALGGNVRFNDVLDLAGHECGYIGSDIEAVTLVGTNPVDVEVTGHPFVSGSTVRFAGVVGTTELNGNVYTVTSTGANNITLDGTDSSQFTSYVADAGDKVGFSTCLRTLTDCRERLNSGRFCGFPGLRSGSVQIA